MQLIRNYSVYLLVYPSAYRYLRDIFLQAALYGIIMATVVKRLMDGGPTVQGTS